MRRDPFFVPSRAYQSLEFKRRHRPAVQFSSGEPRGRALSKISRGALRRWSTEARQVHLVRSFTTHKTFTVTHGEQTNAEVVAALNFTAPDVKVFTVLESRGSNFIRTHVIDRIMAAEIEVARDTSRARVAISSDNYQFGAVREDGDAFVVETVPRRQDELLFKGRIWITKKGFHLKRIEGEPAKNPSFWTSGIHFVADFEPVNGVWVQGRTLARVTIRWLGEYSLQSECGPYRMLLAADAPTRRF